MDRCMTVAIIGFDGYSDMWDDCISLFKRFWPDCPFPIMFVNNTKDVFYENVEVLHAGKNAEWSYKVQMVCEKAETPYICLLLEDFLLGDYIDTFSVKNTISLIQKERIRYFKLINMNRNVKNRDPLYEGYPYLHIIPESDEYGVSLQAAIWDKAYLQQLLGTGNYNAWTFEFDRVKEAEGKTDRPNRGCVFDDRNILHLQHGVIQGQYLPGTIRYFRKRGIELNVERPTMSFVQYYRLRFQSKVKYCIPKSMRLPVKCLMEKLGMKFVSTIRDK